MWQISSHDPTVLFLIISNTVYIDIYILTCITNNFPTHPPGRSLSVLMLLHLWYQLFVSYWVVVLTLISPWPPSFHLVYSLKVLDLGWNSVRSFLVCASYGQQGIWLTVGCRRRLPRSCPSQSSDFSGHCLTLCRYLVFVAFLVVSSWFPFTCAIPRCL